MPRAELVTARLTLRPPRDDDAAWIATEIAKPQVHAMLTAPPKPYRLADAETWLTFARTQPGHYVIVADDPIGVVTLASMTRGPELGYWLRKSAWGQGYMTEAARAVVSEVFLDGATELLSGHLTANAASARVLSKLGFRSAGTASHFSGFYGCDVEIQRMSLTPEDFRTALPWEATSPRLTYRPLQAIDRDALHGIVGHHAVTRQLGSHWPWPADPAFTLSRSCGYRGQGFVWGLFRDGHLIGTVGVTEGELGYAVHPDHHRQRLASEACRTALAQAFGPMGLTAVKAGVWADNQASLGLLSKLGFRVTGHDLGTNACRPDPTPGVQLLLTSDAFTEATNIPREVWRV